MLAGRRGCRGRPAGCGILVAIWGVSSEGIVDRPEDFVVARNPDPDSALPYLIRLPVPGRAVVLKARETWPRTAKVYCHPAPEWPTELEILERVGVRSCVRRGPAIDLILDRGRENRSQFVFTRIRGGREAIFWQSARTAKQARPAVRPTTARAAGVHQLAVLVDSQEKYPYRFATQAVSVGRARLPAGDYGVELDGRLVAAVERKSLADLVGSILSGKLRYALAELSALPRAAVVVEDRYSQVYKLERVRPAVIADALAELQVRWPGVPLVFAETRPLAEQWTYRYLAAALAHLASEDDAAELALTLPSAGLLSPRPVTTSQVRAWAVEAGLPVSDRGRLHPDVRAAYAAAHP